MCSVSKCTCGTWRFCKLISRVSNKVRHMSKRSCLVKQGYKYIFKIKEEMDHPEGFVFSCSGPCPDGK